MQRKIKDLISGDFIIKKGEIFIFSILAIFVFNIFCALAVIGLIMTNDISAIAPAIPLLSLNFYINRCLIIDAKEYKQYKAKKDKNAI